ncbi:ribonuclease T2 [Ranunculus cassubicifolius]
MATQLPRPMFFLVILIALSASAASTTSTSSERVRVDFYYEALCPACMDFLVNGLAEIFTNQLISIIDLHLVPYGNAILGGPDKKTIICQHGAEECFLNTVEGCAIHVSDDVNKHFAFIHCMEEFMMTRKVTTGWEFCFEETGLDPKPVKDCYNGPRGYEVQMGYAKETGNLTPHLWYVPWVVVDGKQIKDYVNFMVYVCNAYKGTPVPQACKTLPLQFTAEKDENNKVQQLCYREEPGRSEQ